MKTITGLLIALTALFINLNSIAADDDFVAYYCSETITIDGNANENFWDTAKWYPLSNVWIPYNQVVTSTDFTGRFKLAWTEERLYILVEIVDDSLFDGHPSPLDNYWNDDCVEVFLDEDHSGGNHLNNYNAFAYHVSTVFDVVDNTNVANTTALFNDNVSAAYTRNDSLYTWELEIKVYPSTYTPANPGSPVTLVANKIMGFSLAYCDTDGSMSRENFFGSKYLPEAQANNSYIDASIFGNLTLLDTTETDTTSHINQINSSKISNFSIYPTVVNDDLTVIINENFANPIQLSIVDIYGKELLKQTIESFINNNVLINTDKLNPGLYYIVSSDNNNKNISSFIKM